MAEQETQSTSETGRADDQLFHECVDCKSKISADAKKCAVCHSFQHRGRHLLSLAPTLSLIVAIIALLPATVSLVTSTLTDKSPEYNVLSFFSDNIAGPNGRIPQVVDFSISAQITNLSEETLIIDDSLQCYTRENIFFNKAKTPSEKTDVIIVVVPDQAGFELYFENTVKTVIPAHTTHTVSWSVTDETYVELDTWHTSKEDRMTKYSASDLEKFYMSILAEFADAKTLKFPDNFPRGVEIEEGEVKSFFLNLDCTFLLENSVSEKYEELHLEFVYEFSGKQGIYPRWSIGKNIGGGFGNGAGSG